MDTVAISILMRNLVAARAGLFCFPMTATPIFNYTIACSFIVFCRPVRNYWLFLKVLQAATGTKQ